MITLALETAIWGGSLSLMAGDREINSWTGKKSVSKAEDLLKIIAEILNYNKIKKIDLIAVSTGPGSATGIRIGLATALGLKKAFDCRIVGVPVFEALTYNKSFQDLTLMAIPYGGKQVAWEIFAAADYEHCVPKIKIGNLKDFLKLFENLNFEKILLHNELAQIVTSTDNKVEKNRIQIMNNNYSILVGLRGIEILNENTNMLDTTASDNVKQLYIPSL